jgi:hypothetical protein
MTCEPYQDGNCGCLIILAEQAFVCYSGPSGAVAVTAIERLGPAELAEDVLALIYAIGVKRVLSLAAVLVIEPERFSSPGRSLATAAVLTAVSIGAAVIAVPESVVRDQLDSKEGIASITARIEAARRASWERGYKFGEVLKPRDWEMHRAAWFGLAELLKTFAGVPAEMIEAA